MSTALCGRHPLEHLPIGEREQKKLIVTLSHAHRLKGILLVRPPPVPARSMVPSDTTTAYRSSSSSYLPHLPAPAQHDNEFVSLLKASNSSKSARSGSFSSSINSATSSIEDLLSALKQHENHQIRKQKQKAKMSSPSAKAEVSPRGTGAQPLATSSSPPGAGDYAGTKDNADPGTHAETSTDSSSGSSDDAKTEDEEEAKLLRRLEIKRREIDDEIEAFKTAKEEEYAEYERRLRERRRRKQQKRKENQEEGARDDDVKHGGQISAHSNSTTRSGILKGLSRFDEEPDELPFAISSPAALLALNEQNSTDSLTLGGSDDSSSQPTQASDREHASEQNEEEEAKYTSPPFEEEIQLAGLFTPRYLPLLDDTYSRTSPVSVSPRPITPTRPASQHAEGSFHGYNRPASPSAPLASSLRNSHSSGFSSGSGPRPLKPKSPKRVSFKLDEAKPIPSRSTPPQTALTFGDDIDQNEDPDAIGVEQLENEDPMNGLGVSPRSTPLFGSNITTSVIAEASTSSSVPSSFRDSLVVPTRITDGVVEVAGGGQFREGGISPRIDDHDWESVDRGDANGGFGAIDDDDEDLFDMDETLPISPTDEDSNSNNPGIRSTSPDFDADNIWTGVAAPSEIVATPHGLREATSLPKYGPISPFGSLGIPQSQLPSGRRGSVPFSFESLERNAVPASVPNKTSANGFGSSLRNGNARQLNGSFRRRSVQKYVDDEPDAPPMPDWHSKGKNIEGGMRFHSTPLLEEDEAEEVPPNIFGSSLPMAIHSGRDSMKKVSKVIQAVKEEELSPTSSAPIGDGADDGLDDQYGDSPQIPAHVHDSPSGDPLFTTDEDYHDHRVAASTVSIHVSAEPDGNISPPRRNSGITFSSPFPAHPVPVSSVERSSAIMAHFPSSVSPTSGGTTPRPAGLASASSPSPNTTTPHIYQPVRFPSRQQLLNPFTSPGFASPYATPLAARIAAEAEENGFDDGIGSVVGGVDGGTGLDPIAPTSTLGAVMGRRASLALLQGIHNARTPGAASLGYGSVMGGAQKRAGGGSFVPQSGGIGITGGGRGRGGLGEEFGELRPEKMSFSMRLALEEHMEKVASVRGR